MTAAILNVRSAAGPGPVSLKSTREFLRLVALNRRRLQRPRLVCHWHCDPDGRLFCVWEQDVGLVYAVERDGNERIAQNCNKQR